MLRNDQKKTQKQDQWPKEEECGYGKKKSDTYVSRFKRHEGKKES